MDKLRLISADISYFVTFLSGESFKALFDSGLRRDDIHSAWLHKEGKLTLEDNDGKKYEFALYPQYDYEMMIQKTREKYRNMMPQPK